MWIVVSLIIWGGTALFKKVKKAQEQETRRNTPNSKPVSNSAQRTQPAPIPSLGRTSPRENKANAVTPFFEQLEVFTNEIKKERAVAVEEVRNRKRFDHYKIKKQQKNTFADFLDDKKNFKKAFILSEILKRPEH